MFVFSEPKIKSQKINNNLSNFFISPLNKGFGITLGNALRRTLLSTIPGSSIFAIKLNDVKHEFSTVTGIVEDVNMIILNLKKLVVKIDDSISNSEFANFKIENWPTLNIDFKGKGVVTANDIVCPTGFQIINKDLIIATSDSENTKFDLKIYAKRGVGFKTFVENRQMINSLGIIPVDSNFSPVLNVSYSIEDVKITSSSFHEQLNISVATNGSISPEEAISAAGKILTDHLKFFSDLSSNQTDYFAEEVIEEDAQISSSSTAASSQKFTQTKNISTSINDLDLSLRSFNALKRHGINSVSQLTEMTLNQLKGIENLGTKSVKEIKRKLESIGLSFKKSSNN